MPLNSISKYRVSAFCVEEDRSLSASGEDDVVDWDKDQFDHVSDNSHDEETHDACLQDLLVLSLVWLLALLVEDDGVVHEILDLLHRVWLLLLVSLVHHSELKY